MIKLTLNQLVSTIEVQQSGLPVPAGSNGILHLQASPFELIVKGDGDHLLAIASPLDDLARQMDDSQHPVLFCAGGGAYREGDLFIARKPRLTNWSDVRNVHSDAQCARWDKFIQDEFGLSDLPLINLPVQALSTYARSGAFHFSVRHLQQHSGEPLHILYDKDEPLVPLPWEDLPQLTLTLVLYERFKESIFSEIAWQHLRLAWDGVRGS